MSRLQVTDKGHRHPYSSGEFLLGQVEETPAFTNQFTKLVCPGPEGAFHCSLDVIPELVLSMR